MTYVPGTTSDLGSLRNDTENAQVIQERAQQMAGDEKVSTVAWNDYKAPLHLPQAAFGGYADDATGDLSNFQEGLRATHEGEPSHNTILGHSYGTTAIGFTAQQQGVHADDIAFLGSPGVGPDHARELGVPPENVWAGRSEEDSISAAGPPGFIDKWDGVDDQRFGVAPSDPPFGANEIPTDPKTGHTGYFEDKKAVDGVAKIVSGRAEGQG